MTGSPSMEWEEKKAEPERRTVDLWPDAGRQLGLGRNSTYEAAKRGEIPVLRFGRRLVVSTAWLNRVLG